MEFAELFIRTPDGPSLFLRDFAPEGGARGLPVICLHGLTRNSLDFEAVAPRIAALGRRVIAIDMRGRGRSDRDPKPERYRSDVYAQDVQGVMDSLNIPRAVFIGTSMGGIITMLLTASAAPRIAAAVLNDIGPVLNPAGLARIAGYVGKSGPVNSWDEMMDAVRVAQTIAFPDCDIAFWETFTRRVSEQLPDGRYAFAYDPAIANAFAQPASPPPSVMPLFQALAAVPVLAIRGELSDLLSPEGVEAMRAVKPGLEFVQVPRVGHAPTLEEPQAWNAIAAFLAHVP